MSTYNYETFVIGAREKLSPNQKPTLVSYHFIRDIQYMRVFFAFDKDNHCVKPNKFTNMVSMIYND